jgi:hypothetical protein
MQCGVVDLIAERGRWRPTVLLFHPTLCDPNARVRNVGGIEKNRHWPRLHQQLVEFFPLSRIEATLTIEGQIAERGMADRDGTPAIEGDEISAYLHVDRETRGESPAHPAERFDRTRLRRDARTHHLRRRCSSAAEPHVPILAAGIVSRRS